MFLRGDGPVFRTIATSVGLSAKPGVFVSLGNTFMPGGMSFLLPQPETP